MVTARRPTWSITMRCISATSSSVSSDTSPSPQVSMMTSTPASSDMSMVARMPSGSISPPGVNLVGRWIHRPAQSGLDFVRTLRQ